jgi:hypothetical protein
MDDDETSAAATAGARVAREGRKAPLRQLRVPVRDDEEQAIKAQAASVGLSVASFLRNVGLGYRVAGIVDHEQVKELARINGDLGRLGGLLKMWLTNDEKLARFPQAQADEAIRTVLAKIEGNQDRIQAVMATVLRRGSL